MSTTLAPPEPGPWVTWETISCTTIVAILLCITVVMSGYSAYKKYWSETGVNKSVWIVVVVAAIFYVGAVFFAFLTFLFILTVGYSPASEEGVNNHPVTSSTFYVFSLFYLIALYLNIYIWIQRLQTTFAESAYGYSARFFRTLRIVFFLTIIIGFLTLILFIINEPVKGVLQIPVLLLTIIFILLFIGLLLVLLGAFIYKLVQLRKLAESRFDLEVKDIDPATLRTIQKLLWLQLKLTVLAVTQILSTLVALVLAIVADDYKGNMAMSIDNFIGFMCIYCTIKSHDIVFKNVCCGCIKCFNVCIKAEEVEERFTQQIAVHTQSQMSSGAPMSDPSDKNSSGAADNSSMASRPKNKHQSQESGTMTTTAPNSTPHLRANMRSEEQTQTQTQTQTAEQLAVVSEQTLPEVEEP